MSEKSEKRLLAENSLVLEILYTNVFTFDILKTHLTITTFSCMCDGFMDCCKK